MIEVRSGLLGTPNMREGTELNEKMLILSNTRTHVSDNQKNFNNII